MVKQILRAAKKAISHRNPVRLSWHKAKAFMAAARFGFPARKLTVIGITGTDGKTTTVGMTAHILHTNGIACGALSTAFFRIKETVTWNATQKTSPSPFVIQSFLKKLVDEGCTHAVLEYSSHGLVQGRLNYTWPKVTAITNTSAEHLDYHGTMEQYRKDKGILFQMLKGGGTKVLNKSDETYRLYSSIPSATTIAYSVSSGMIDEDEDTLWVSDISVKTLHTSALLHKGNSEPAVPLTLKITGAFNIENALCAIGCATSTGLSVQKCASSLESFAGVPGRIERIDEGQSFAVFVDFTVTPASYERTLSTVKDMLEPGKKLHVLTGSCGDRMREKRPLIGAICSRLADTVVVSNEDPYTEDPEKIIDEVWSGIDTKTTEARRIVDRKEAIQFLFKKAQPGDIVILCGKGSDTTMWLKDGQVPWNEREIARGMLREMRK